MKPARILIAEDEAPMCERLLQQLALTWPAAQVVAVAENGLDAWDAFLEHEPDVVFLDIRMPGMSGLELAARIETMQAGSGNRQCHIVFVTAYDQHALEAFDKGAIDYLLKPIDAARLAKTVSKLSQQDRQAADLSTLLRQLRQVAQPAQDYLKWIKATVGKQIKLIPVDEVLYFQSDTKYTRVVLKDSEALIRTPLKDLLSTLDPQRFWQIHRGALVNAHAIAAAERLDAERLQLILKDHPDKLTVSRAFAYLFKV